MNSNKILAGALSGLLAAAAVDYMAFKSAQSWAEFIDKVVKYDWRIALVRWLVGAVAGAVGAAGIAIPEVI